MVKDTPEIESAENNPKIIEAEKNRDKQAQSAKPQINLIDHTEKITPISKRLVSPSSADSKTKTKSGSFSKKKLEDGTDEITSEVASLQHPAHAFPVIKPIQTKDQPKQRPQLSPDLIHGPLMKSLSSAPRIGEIAIECRLHPYGVYIQKMLQSIEEQWNQLAIGSLQYLQRDRLPGKVTLKFKLQATGKISNLTRIDQEGYTLAAELCRQAVASRVPFGEWTEKMIKDFGQSDEITLSFQYQ